MLRARRFAGWALVLLIVAVILVQVQAAIDPETSFKVLSKKIKKPDVVKCGYRGRPCYKKHLTCKPECPSRKKLKYGSLNCFVDCNLCTVSCRKRIPGCNGYGAVCYDPRFIGGDGVMFYFHGKKEQDFCLVSDQYIHINGHFIGKRLEGRTRDYTWVQSLGILFESHHITVGAKRVAVWKADEDQLTLTYDSKTISIPAILGSTWTSPDGKITLERIAEKNSVFLVIAQTMEVLATVVPITAEDSRVHNYQISKDDCFAHVNLNFNFYNLTSRVHGVLGQTYQPDYQSPVKVGVPMPIMGGDEKYVSSSLLSTDCEVSQFQMVNLHPAEMKNILSAGDAIHMSCDSGESGAMTCRR